MKKLLGLGLAIIMVVSLCACGETQKETETTTSKTTEKTTETAGTTTEAAKSDVVIEPVELSAATFLAETAPSSKVFAKLQERTNEILGGEYVTITLYPSGTLAGGMDMLDALDSGLCDIGLVNVANFINRFPVIELTEQPGMVFESGQQVTAAVYEFIKEYEPAANEVSNYKFLNVLGAGYGAIYSKKQIHSFDDIKNLQMRCTNSTKEVVESMGAIPVTLEWSECYEALRNNLVDSLYADAAAGSFIGVNEVAEYYAFVPMLNTDSLFLLSNLAYDKLQPEVAAALLQAAEEIQYDYIIPVLADTTLAMPQTFFESLTEVTFFSDADLNKLKEAQAPILESYKQSLNDSGYNADEALDAFNSYLEKYAEDYSMDTFINYVKESCPNVYEGK